MRIFFTIIGVLFVLSSCTQDQTYTVKKTDQGIMHYNNKKPAQPNLKITFELYCSIPFSFKNEQGEELAFGNPQMIAVDSKENIFIFDSKLCKIYKFTHDGNFIKSFANKGNGPGELNYMGSGSIINDTIYISDQSNNSIIKFDTDGNFVGNINLDERSPRFLQNLNNANILGRSVQFKMENNKTIIQSSVNSYDNTFKKQKSFFHIEKKVNSNNTQLDPNEILPFYACLKNKVVIGNIDKNNYKINIFDLDGKQQAVITRSYLKTEMSSEEAKEIAKLVNLGSKNNIEKSYYHAINGLWSNQEDQLWVLSVNEKLRKNNKELWFDIYKDNIWLNTIKFPYLKSYYDMNLQFKFNITKNKISIIDAENESIKIYRYTLEL